MALSFVDNFDDHVDLVPDDLSEHLDFAEDLDEGLLSSYVLSNPVVHTVFK